MQGLAQRLVGRVREEALAEGQQGILEAAAQAVAGPGALLAGGRAPGLQGAGVGVLVGAPEAGAVEQQPGGGEVRVQALGEDPGEVQLHPGRAGEARVVAHQPQPETVGAEAPQGLVRRVQELLDQAEGAALAVAVA